MVADDEVLTERSELVMWGNGCLTAPVTTFSIVPTQGGGCRVEIVVTGVAHRGPRQAMVALDREQVRELVGVVRDDRNETPPFRRTGIGNVQGKLTLSSGPLAVFVTAPDPLARISAFSSTLVRRAGLPVADSMLPIPR